MASLEVQHLSKHYQFHANTIEVLHDVTFSLSKGEAACITGPSGSGKSTLLHLIGTLDYPSSGTILIENKNPFQMPEPELAFFRNTQIGFVFQDHHLLPQYSVLENVLLPTLAGGKRDHRKRAEYLIDAVGLGDRLLHRPSELSGGERQRVAVARSLINHPSLLLCDEPTGNLDQVTAESVAQLFFELHKREQNIMIVVTHSLELARQFNIRYRLKQGNLVKE